MLPECAVLWLLVSPRNRARSPCQECEAQALDSMGSKGGASCRSASVVADDFAQRLLLRVGVNVFFNREDGNHGTVARVRRATGCTVIASVQVMAIAIAVTGPQGLVEDAGEFEWFRSGF